MKISVDQANVVLFPVGSWSVEAEGVWGALGLPPVESIQKLPVEQVVRVSGSDETFAYSLAAGPLRIDLTITARAPQPVVGGAFPVFGIVDIRRLFDRLFPLSETLASQPLPPISRLGIAVNASVGFESYEDASAFLVDENSEYIAAHARDLVDLAFQRNKRAHIDDGNWDLNRLEQWNIAETMFQIGVMNGTPWTSQGRSWNTRVLLDYNSVPSADKIWDSTTSSAAMREISRHISERMGPWSYEDE